MPEYCPILAVVASTRKAYRSLEPYFFVVFLELLAFAICVRRGGGFGEACNIIFIIIIMINR
jgi:hypothetical protein